MAPNPLWETEATGAYLKFEKGSATIDREKVEQEARFDGKWVLRTNTRLSAKNVALKYKELWQVEHTFREHEIGSGNPARLPSPG